MITAEEFFKELNRIIAARPKISTQVLHSENVEWGHNCYYCKNLYWSFDNLKCNDGSYVYDSMSTVDSTDVDYCTEAQLCYDSVDAFKCYNSAFLENCANLRDSWYSVRCNGGNDLFGCVGLKNKSFCIFNRQLTEQDYRQKVEEYKKWPQDKVWSVVRDLEKRYPVTQTNEMYNENSSYGNYVYYSKNCYLCFDTSNCQDSGYLYNCVDQKNCFDLTYCSNDNQLAYEATDSGQIFNSNYIVWSANITDSWYLLDTANMKNCFGVSGMAHKQYMFLNRQLSKEEYERITSEVLADILKKNLGWADLEYFKE